MVTGEGSVISGTVGYEGEARCCFAEMRNSGLCLMVVKSDGGVVEVRSGLEGGRDRACQPITSGALDEVTCPMLRLLPGRD